MSLGRVSLSKVYGGLNVSDQVRWKKAALLKPQEKEGCNLLGFQCRETLYMTEVTNMGTCPNVRVSYI